MIKSPLIKFCLVFIIGIIIAHYYRLCSDIFIGIFFLTVSVAFIFEIFIKHSIFWKNIIIEIIIIKAVLFAGIVITIIKTDDNQNNHFSNFISTDKKINYQSLIKLSSPIKINEKSVKIEGEVKEIKYPYSKFSVTGKTVIYLDKDSLSRSLLPGDIIVVYSSFTMLKGVTNPGQFNYQNYLEKKQIEYVNYTNNNWQFISSEFSLIRFATICRNYCVNSFEKAGLNGSELAIASALTFGYKDDLENDVKSSFSSAGAMHVLAVSGLHVGIIYLIFISFFKMILIPERYKWVVYILILFILWFYTFVSGLTPSVVRACTMFSFFILADAINKSANVFNILAASAIFLLIVDPFLIMQVSFQLSYLAVLGILYLQPKINRLFVSRFWIINKVWDLTTVSIAAQLATFPLTIYYFHQFPNYFVLTNLLVIPMAFVILIIGIVIIILSFYNPFTFFLGSLYYLVLKIFYKSINFINHIPGSNSKGFSINLFETISIYLLLLLIIAYIRTKKAQYIYSSFLVISLLFFIDCREDFKLDNLNRIIIYDIKDHFAMDLISGNNHYLICDEYLLNNKQKLLFHVQNNWFNLDLNKPVYINLNSLLDKSLDWKNKSIAFIGEKWNNQNPFDIAILCTPKKRNECILNTINSEILVFRSVKSDFRHNLFNSLKNKSSLYNISISGAYIHDI